MACDRPVSWLEIAKSEKENHYRLQIKASACLCSVYICSPYRQRSRSTTRLSHAPTSRISTKAAASFASM